MVGMVAFLIGCTTIAFITEAMHRARARANEAEAAAKIAIERTRAEEAIRQQADLVRLSFDAIIVWRVDGAIESWNRGAEELYGFTEGEAIGHKTHELLRTVHPVPWSEINATLKDRGNWEGELRHRTRDGREVIVSARHQLVYGRDGIARVMETNRDITGHHKAQREREVTIEFLRLVNASIGTRDLIRAVATFFQEQAGCEAVGMRLWEAEDYPYFEARGFPKEFVLAGIVFAAGTSPGR
ncbi:MAG TPA: hypothetical protein DCP92_17815 [Nitrospiraceae bacterium]|jgi:PAS domain S-box-containing protein|nr:hypothetical protein [Nitrospiraceae bacterium]